MVATTKRTEKKRKHYATLRQNIGKLTAKLNADTRSKDEAMQLTACVLKIMVLTSERVGNLDSAKNGHFGISTLQKQHIQCQQNGMVRLRYVGKSGVSQDKTFNDATVAAILRGRLAQLKKPTDFVFQKSNGFMVSRQAVNIYLTDFGITSKDIRTHNANVELAKNAANCGPIDKVCRKKAVETTAQKIGNKPKTLQTHYILDKK